MKTKKEYQRHQAAAENTPAMVKEAFLKRRGKGHKQQQAEKKNSSATANTVNAERWKYYVALAIILILSFLVFFPALRNEFVWDDSSYIVNNHFIKDLSWNGITAIFTNFSSDNYAPVTDLINAVQYRMAGLSPAMFHLGSLLFHLINIVLVFWFIRLLTGNWNIATVSALLFSIHPMQSESVVWASGGSNLFCAAFFLGSLIAYLYYLRKNQTWYLSVSLLFFILSVLSKAVAVVLPILLILIDYYKDRKITIKTIVEKIPFLMLSIGSGILTLWLKNQADAIANFAVFSFPQRIIFASYGFITYLLKLIFPLHLSAFYPYPIKIGGDIPIIYYFYALLFLGLAAYVIYSLRFSKKYFFGIGFFTVNVFLVLQLLPIGEAIMADRYSYIPSIGIFYLAGEGLNLLWGKKLKLVTILLLSAFTLFFSVKTYARCEVWKNDLALWNDVISQYQNIAIAYNNRGNVFMNEERNEEAISDFSKAIELRPDFTRAYYNRGKVFSNEKRYEEALQDLSKAIELKPDLAEAYNNRGNVLSSEKRYEQALNDFNKAINLRPDYAVAYNNRGIVFSNTKRYEEAINDFIRAVELKPDYAEAYNNRGNVFYVEMRYKESIGIYTKAIALKPDYAQAYYNRGLAEFYSGNKDAACTDVKQAASLGYKPASDAISRVCK